MLISPVITHGLVTLALTVLQVATNDLRVGITGNFGQGDQVERGRQRLSRCEWLSLFNKCVIQEGILSPEMASFGK